jgi:predicted aspartyl protease
MAIIAKKLKLVGSKGEKELEGLFDSGATYSCIEKELAQRLEIFTTLATPLKLGTAKKGKSLAVKERVTLDFYLNGYRFSDEFMVISDLSEEVIIGAATMQKWRFKLDFENEDVIIDPRVTRLRLL